MDIGWSSIGFLFLLFVLVTGNSGCMFHFDRSLSPGEVRGTVVEAPSPGASLVPVAGARVVIENSSLHVTADSHGAFDLTKVPAGTYAIDITAPPGDAGTVAQGIHLSGITLAALSGGAGDGLDLGRIVLGTLGGIEGTVTSEGASLTGAFAVLPDLTQMVSVNGAFSFSNLNPGTYSLSLVEVSSAGTARIAPPVRVVVNPGEITHVPNIDIPLNPILSQGGIAGRVELLGASSSKGATVTLLGTSIAAQTTDAAGDYSQSGVAADVYTLTASAPGYQSATVGGIIVGGTTTNIPVIVLSPGTNPPANPSTVGGTVSSRSTNFHLVLTPGRAEQPARSPGYRLDPGSLTAHAATDGGTL
jgi:hypothetical protein